MAARIVTNDHKVPLPLLMEVIIVNGKIVINDIVWEKPY